MFCDTSCWTRRAHAKIQKAVKIDLNSNCISLENLDKIFSDSKTLKIGGILVWCLKSEYQSYMHSRGQQLSKRKRAEAFETSGL